MDNDFITKSIEYVRNELEKTIPSDSIGWDGNSFLLNDKTYYIKVSNYWKNKSSDFLISSELKNQYDAILCVKYLSKKDIIIKGYKESKDISTFRNGYYVISENNLDNFNFNLLPTEDTILSLELKRDYLTAEVEEAKYNGWKVLAGSEIRAKVVPSLRKNIKYLREILNAAGVIDNFSFKEDYVFDTLSEAACFILGREVNGRDAFKVKGTNKSYNDYINITC